MKRITLLVDDKVAKIILPLIIDNAGLRELSVTEEPSDVPDATKKITRYRPHNGLTLAQELAQHFPIGRTFTLTQARNFAANRGYKPGSATGSLSNLCSQGIVLRLDRATYQKAKDFPTGGLTNRVE